MHDILIRCGKVVDGSGSPAFDADVAIEAGEIVAVGDLPQAGARRTIEAGGAWWRRASSTPTAIPSSR